MKIGDMIMLSSGPVYHFDLTNPAAVLIAKIPRQDYLEYAHANMPGIYLGRREDGLHVIMMSDRRIYFPQIEGNFAKVEEA